DRPHRAIGTLRAREAFGGSAGLRRFLDRETGVALLLLDLLEGESARKRILLVRDLRPFREKLGVLLGPILIALRELALRIDRIDRALGDAELAIDARVGIDHEHGGLVDLVKAVDRANGEAIRVAAIDAPSDYDVSHRCFLSSRVKDGTANRISRCPA